MKKNKQKRNRRFIQALIFIVFTSVLFINNTTSLLNKFNLTYEINLIAWIGIIGSVIYAIYKVSGGEL